MYFSVPTLKNKVEYSIVDITRFYKGETANNYSDGNRLLSFKLGIEVGSENPLFGVGVGDVRNKMMTKYKNDHPEISEENRLIPHNQFIFTYAATGIAGLLLFISFTFFPLFYKSSYNNILFLSITIIIVSSYLSEATIENQLGVGIYALFSLIAYQYNSYTNENRISSKQQS